MSNIVMENSRISLIRSVFILLNYIFAIIGGYSRIARYIISKVENNMKNSVIVVNLILYVAIILITVILAYPLIEESFKKFKRNSFNDLFSILSIMAIILVLIILIANKFDIQISLNQVKNEGTLKKNILYFTFITLIYAPIVEEVVFRGIFYQGIKSSCGSIISIIISSLLFGIIHNVSFLNNWSFSQIIYIIIYFVMGSAFCISYDYSKCIFGAIINHFLWNLFTLVIMIIKIII